MKTLEMLEKRVRALVDMVQELQANNVSLSKENKELQEQIQVMEKTIMQESKNLDNLKVEQDKTKSFVDSLIKDIDALVEHGNNL
ncbi:cell division protein ZapB [Candidatus Babeliales bacterium]|nr:cell division protein ZapB [Candidatus Babeliales bacterium]